MRKFILVCFYILFSALPISSAQPISSFKLIGKGVLKYYLWDVYEASLFSESGKINAKEEFALVLRYFLNLKGEKIAERSIEEMKGVGCTDSLKHEGWLLEMKKLFPDVGPGVSLKGVKHSESRASFYKNDQFLGEIDDDKFAECFFNIWLSEKTSEPELRQQLLGERK
jgi:hypothetical protein